MRVLSRRIWSKITYTEVWPLYKLAYKDEILNGTVFDNMREGPSAERTDTEFDVDKLSE